jgi:hypothetical protein
MKKIIRTADLNHYLMGDHVEYHTVTYQTCINFLSGTDVNPGTATIIITGMEKYAGEISTTFNIIK